MQVAVLERIGGTLIPHLLRVQAKGFRRGGTSAISFRNRRPLARCLQEKPQDGVFKAKPADG